MTAPDEVRFQFGPAERPTFIAGLRHAQVAMLVVAAASAVVFLRLVGGSFGAGFAALLGLGGVGLAFGQIGGRPLDDWIPAASRWTTLVVARRMQWHSAAPATGERDVEPGSDRPGPGRASPPPLVRDWKLLYTKVGDTEIGVLADRRHRTWLVTVPVRGRGFPLLNPSDQVRRLAAWAAVEASLARHGSAVSRFGWIERTRPEPGDDMGAYLSERARGSGPPLDSYRLLLEEAAGSTWCHETYVVVQISALKASRQINNGGGGDHGAVAVLYREVAHLRRQLHDAELEVDVPLSGDRLGSLVRRGFDPFGHPGVDAVVPARSVWPVGTEVAWGHYRTDGACHVTYWVSQWPRLGVGPTFLAPLLVGSVGICRTIALVAEPIPSDKAVREIEHAQVARLADEEMRQRAGYRSSARRRRESEALDRREYELADGHAECRYSAYVTVSGTSLGEVERLGAQMEQDAYRCSVELHRLWGEQDVAFYTTGPFALGLRT